MPQQILIVDDSSVVRKHLRAILVQGGYQVLEAADGPECLSLLRQRNDVTLVLCDVNMPHMDGVETLECIKAEATISPVPVVMVTAERQPELLRRAIASGARAWLMKPFKAALVLGAVRALAGPPESSALL